MLSRAGSPWMPTPNSSESGLTSKARPPSPGLRWASAAIATVRDRATMSRPRAARSVRDIPSSAAAPSTFSTMTVAAVPRLPTFPASREPQSSSTRTCSTGMPSARNLSAAMLKFRTSPV